MIKKALEFGSPFSGMKSDRKLNKEETLRAMRFVLAAEYEATQLYTQLADSISDPDAQKVLRDVADEELVHAGEFMAIVKKLNPDEEKLYDKGTKEVADLIKKVAQKIKFNESTEKYAKMNLSELYRLETEFQEYLKEREATRAISTLEKIMSKIDDLTIEMIKEEKTTADKIRTFRQLVSFGLPTAVYVIKWLEDPEKTKKEITEKCK